MNLATLIAGISARDSSIRLPLDLGTDPSIGSIHYRAQDVRPGGMFVAIKGMAADGHDYIDTALARGAAAIVVQQDVAADVPVIHAENTRRALAALAAAFYGHPSQRIRVIGITGTNGKTTVAYLLESILQAAGCVPGVIGTINYRFKGDVFDNPVTTPESLDLQRILSQMVDAGVTHVVLEVSSHALDQHRVASCALDVAAFTNLTQDHLDYHRDMASYWASKASLFSRLLPAPPKGRHAVAVVNGNSPHGRRLLRSATVRCISAGHGPGNTVRMVGVRQGANDVCGTIVTADARIPFSSPLVGYHNQENILVAAGIALGLDLPHDAVQNGIASVSSVPGRLESVPSDNGLRVYVDYAHTPDALKNVLTSLRALTGAGQHLVCVFGCGGDRDPEKRPQMGEIAGRLCDTVCLTSDNPRSEDPAAIIAQIETGLKTVRQYSGGNESSDRVNRSGYWVEPDRRKAIYAAIAAAKPGDIVLIAGKGHETYQILKDRTIDFDDRRVAAAALAEVSGSGQAVQALESGGEPHPQASPPAPLWNLGDSLTATGGTLYGEAPDREFTGIAIDSRTIRPDEIFVAIRGEVHDGHAFIEPVIAKGVRAVVLEEAEVARLPLAHWLQKGVACIAVADTNRALGDLAQYHRNRCPASVAAITGSNGKTTTRELTAAVLRQRYDTLSSRKNFNNLIGVPLTLFELNFDYQWAVIELGMNAFGEIDRLAEICRPDVGLITNIGPAHLEGVGSLDGVMRAKGELLERIRSGGTAVLNADDPRLMRLEDRFHGPVVRFGCGENAHVRAVDIRPQERETRFKLTLPAEQIDIRLKLPGTFMVANALAAAAVGVCLEMKAAEIKAGLESASVVHGRMNLVKTANGITIIDDTYNANPGSMAAALDGLRQLKQKNRGIAIIGDMYELGDSAAALHEDIGIRAARSDLAYLMATGANAPAVAKGALNTGMTPDRIVTGSKQELLTAAAAILQPGDWVLVKGSRAMTMETVVMGLQKWSETGSLP